MLTSIRLLCLLGSLTSLGCGGASRTSTKASPPEPTQAASAKTEESAFRLHTKTTLQPPVLVESKSPIICIYNDYWYGDRLHGLEAAVWADGRVVWFQDGKPFSGYTTVANINKLLLMLHQEGVFGDGTCEFQFAVPDTDCEGIIIKLHDRKLRFLSCHELFERNSNLVATAHGITSLEGRDRKEVLSQEPSEFQRFRRIWGEIRSSVKSWTHKDGFPFVGDILIEKYEAEE